MNQQQLQLLELAKEFYDSKPLYGETTFEMYLKNCPDALTHLFDLCLIKPMLEQVIFLKTSGYFLLDINLFLVFSTKLEKRLLTLCFVTDARGCLL